MSLTVAGCGGGSGHATAAPRSTGSSTTASTTTTTSGPTPDACAVADSAAVQAIIGPLSGPPTASSAPSPDGVGPVLNCVLLAGAGQMKEVDYVQRLHFGRAAFEKNRAAAGQTVDVGTDGYWIPAMSRLIELDGDDLVAIVVQHVTIDLPTAKALLDHAVSVRHASANAVPSTTAATPTTAGPPG